MSNKFPAKVVKLIDDERVVINRGSNDDVREGQRFLIYKLGDEIFDPATKDSLGILEILVGKARVEYVQLNMATLISDNFSYQEEEILPASGGFGGLSLALMGGGQKRRTNKYREPFRNVEINDLVKPV